MVMKELLNQLGDLQLSLLISNKVDRNLISNEWVISYLGKFHATHANQDSVYNLRYSRWSKSLEGMSTVMIKE